MVKRSKKSKSKRVSLKKKYKVIKKVKEHHKKKAKEAKKLGFNRKTKAEKDPGIPNDWPFKEQELKTLEDKRARAVEELEQKKAARKERAQKRKLGQLNGNDATEAADAGKHVDREKGGDKEIGVSKNRDNSDRAFYQELVKVIEASDVILEVLDARDPLGTRCADMEKMVMESGAQKRLVLLLNKIDLVPRESIEKWLKYLREELPAIAFKCSTQEQKSNLGRKSSKASKLGTSYLQTSDCLGADALMKLLKNYTRSHEIKKSITVGIIGIPNVGKSSLINSLKRSHVANVGAMPGLTRSMQEIQLDKNIKLLDCPGVVMLKSRENDPSIALRNCKRIEKLDDPVSPVKEIVKLCPTDVLVKLYKIASYESVDDFLHKVAMIRGKLKKGGVVDIDAAARIVLHDWNEGKMAYYTMPPARNQEESSDAKIVSELSKEFNIDEVYGSEASFIGSLDPVDSIHHVEMPSNCPLMFDEKMLKGDMEAQPSSQSRKDSDAMTDDVDHPDSDDEPLRSGEDGPDKVQFKNDTTQQNEKLYAAQGILNPKRLRAEKKKRKKGIKLQQEDDMDDDYDFKVDYTQGGTAGGGGEADDGTDEVGVVPMSGIDD